MIQDYEEILKCLRGKSSEDLTKVRLETPSFLAGMGPSRDGILIPADFGTDLGPILQNSVSAGNLLEKFSSTNFGQISTENKHI
jgi:hypothetical protein